MNTGIYSFSTGVVDFPDKWAMTVYFSGCNMDCDFCYNKHVITDPPNYTAEEVWGEFLSLRKLTPNIGMVFSGGEPTCNKDMRTLRDNCMKMGIPMAMHTNGISMTGFGSYLDSIILSLKPTSSEGYLERMLIAIQKCEGISKKQLRYVTNVEGEDNYSLLLNALAPVLKDWDVVPIENVLK